MALEMKFGNDPKKLATLGILFVVLLYVVYTNLLSGPDTPAPRPAPTAATTAANPPATSSPATSLPATLANPSAAVGAGASSALRKTDRKRTTPDRRAQEFRPIVGPARPEDRPDPMSVDPSLRLDLLARLEKVQFAGGMRSLFDFSNAPAPGAPPKIIPAPKKTVKAPPPFVGPMPKPADPPPQPPPPPPTAPPIPLKFYGFTSPGLGQAKGPRRAFFLDGEDILVASEGETLKARYKVIRIGVTSATLEDVQFKQQQTIPIVPDAPIG